MTFQHGYNAQAAGATIADCPFAPSDPDGLEWRRGFIQAEWNARVMNGTAGATEEEKADARAWIADELRPDPVVEILGGYEELEPDPFAAHYAQHLVDRCWCACVRRWRGELAHRLLELPGVDVECVDEELGVGLAVAGPIPANGARKRTNTGRRKIPPREESRYTCPRHGIQDAGFCRACTVRRPQQFANRGRR